jgi:eukaryotic-like serine/threonine-protein kinase
MRVQPSVHIRLGNSSSGHFDQIDLPERPGVSVFVKSVQDPNAYRRELTDLQGIPGVAVLMGSDDSSRLIVTERAEGATLEQMLRYQIDDLEPDDILRIFSGLARTVASMHSTGEGTSHFDLTPSNIVVDNRRSTVLVDFGLSQRGRSAESELVQTKAGTPLYLSPERVRRDLSLPPAASDAFALGVIGYELLKGTPPFDPALGNVERQILNDSPDPPSTKRWPQEVVTLIMGLLEKDPRNRATSANLLQLPCL